MAFYPTDRIALFIDGANTFSASKSLQLDIDYKRLLEEFRNKGVLVRAHYYTALIESEDQDFVSLRPLVDWLDYNGFTVVTRTAREIVDSQGRTRRIGGDMDVNIACDMLEMSDHVDHVVLFSGDGDFCRLVQAMQKKGVRVTVVSTTKSQFQVSDDLRRQADTFIDLADLGHVLGRPAQNNSGVDRTLRTPRDERQRAEA